MAGILAGDGTASMGRYKGVAPGCGITSLKVLDGNGNGSRENVLQAFQWILENRNRYRIRIVNISVGTTYRTKNDQDVLIKGVEKLWDEGLVVVAAAGNQGPKPGSVTAPGCSKKVITVGSSDMLSGSSAVSGRGPTFECVCKPDLGGSGKQGDFLRRRRKPFLRDKKRYIHVYAAYFRGGCPDAGKESAADECGDQNDAERKRRRYGASEKSAGMGGNLTSESL